MNFRERGVTVGDLFLLIFIISTLFIVNKLKDEKNQDKISVISNEIATKMLI